MATKLEELKAAQAATARASAWAAWAVDWAARAAAYEAELKKTQEENPDD